RLAPSHEATPASEDVASRGQQLLPRADIAEVRDGPETGVCMMSERRAQSICIKFYPFTVTFFSFVSYHPPAREDLAMRVYMFGGVLAVVSGIGLFGFALPPHEGGASGADVVLIHHALADEGIDASDVRFGD